MTDTTQDAEFEKGMEELYREFTTQYKKEVLFENIFSYYKNNAYIFQEPLQNYNLSKELILKKYYTSSFLHSLISIEVILKVIIIKPILSSLSFDSRATELLYSSTFKYKSIKHIPRAYFEILKDITDIDVIKLKNDKSTNTFWNDICLLQEIRNNTVHQGHFINKESAEKALAIATYLTKDIAQRVLNVFHYHVENDKICFGGSDYHNLFETNN